MIGKIDDPDYEHGPGLGFQWQNGELVPMHPKWLMDEAGSSYMFPDWPGPWD
jgi:hypothetical protein